MADAPAVVEQEQRIAELTAEVRLLSEKGELLQSELVAVTAASAVAAAEQETATKKAEQQCAAAQLANEKLEKLESEKLAAEQTAQQVKREAAEARAKQAKKYEAKLGELEQARLHAQEQLEQQHAAQLKRLSHARQQAEEKARSAESVISEMMDQASLEQVKLARMRGEPDALEGLDVEQLQTLEGELSGGMARIQEYLRRAQQLELERRLRDEMEAEEDPFCVVCLDRKKTHILVPCGHQIVCEGCAANCPTQPCPICRVQCQTVMKVHK